GWGRRVCHRPHLAGDRAPAGSRSGRHRAAARRGVGHDPSLPLCNRQISAHQADAWSGRRRRRYHTVALVGRNRYTERTRGRLRTLLPVAPPLNDPAIPESALGARLGWRLGWRETARSGASSASRAGKKASRGGAEAAERSVAHGTPIAVQFSPRPPRLRV